MTPTNPKPRNRFYWLEGVSRKEVEQSLSDRRPSRLRDQGPRQVLVLAQAGVIATLLLTVFVAQNKVRTYSEGVLLILGLVLWFHLRTAVRLVSDAPDELLDERQIAMRNAAHTAAYRALCSLIVVYGVILSMITPGGLLYVQVADGAWKGLAWSCLLCLMSLPAMVLAWQLPNEPGDERGNDTA